MGDLPKEQREPAIAFSKCAVDFAGPRLEVISAYGRVS